MRTTYCIRPWTRSKTLTVTETISQSIPYFWTHPRRLCSFFLGNHKSWQQKKLHLNQSHVWIYRKLHLKSWTFKPCYLIPWCLFLTPHPSQILAWHHDFLCIFPWSCVRTSKAASGVFEDCFSTELDKSRSTQLRKGLRISPANGGHAHKGSQTDHLSRDSWLILFQNALSTALFTDFTRLSYQVRLVSACRHSMGSWTNQFTSAELLHKLRKLVRHSIHVKHSSFTFLRTLKVAKFYLFENWFLNCCWAFKSEICTRSLIAGGEVISERLRHE